MIRTHRRGFTLVELLVVIAIIGILMAIAVPGVMLARAAARKRQCLSRQGQLAIALQQYEENKGQLPPYVHTSATRNVAWPVLLFEYMGRSDMGKAWKDSPGQGPEALIEELICPSSGDGGVLNTLNYAANLGFWDGTAASNGVFGNGSRKLTSDKIVGGSEHVMAFAENLEATPWRINPDPLVDITTYAGGLGIVYSDVLPNDCGIAVKNSSPTVYPNTCGNPFMLDGQITTARAHAGNTAFARPSSMHPGGAGMAFLTGRTQFINDDVDQTIYLTWLCPAREE